MKPLRLSALAAALALAACSAPAPTDPALLDAATPSFDEGPGMMGSGNKDGGGVLGSGDNSMEDGGGSLGSGNYTGDTTQDGGTDDDPSRTGVGTMGSGG